MSEQERSLIVTEHSWTLAAPVGKALTQRSNRDDGVIDREGLRALRACPPSLNLHLFLPDRAREDPLPWLGQIVHTCSDCERTSAYECRQRRGNRARWTRPRLPRPDRVGRSRSEDSAAGKTE